MKTAALDAADIRILTAVQSHGPLSKSKLADMVNLSPTPCWARLDRLKSAGYINGFHADIALERLVDFTQVVVTVSLSQHRKTDFERFEAMVERLDEITFCVATGGGMDYVLHVVTPSLSAFQTLMDDMLSEELSIDRYMTYIATRRIKSTPPNISKLISGSGP